MIEKGIRVGLIGEAITTVTSDQTSVIMGSGSMQVLATPAMIALMEAAAVSAIDPYLSKGKTSVGIEVSVRHMSATPVGERITALAEVTRMDGRRITLEIRAWDERELIGEGVHIRYLIDGDEFLSRVKKSDNNINTDL